MAYVVDPELTLVAPIGPRKPTISRVNLSRDIERAMVKVAALLNAAEDGGDIYLPSRQAAAVLVGITRMIRGRIKDGACHDLVDELECQLHLSLAEQHLIIVCRAHLRQLPAKELSRHLSQAIAELDLAGEYCGVGFAAGGRIH